MNTFKELAMCDYQNIIYKRFPKLMIVSSFEANITWLNVFLKKNLISKTISSSARVLGTKKIDATNETL